MQIARARGMTKMRRPLASTKAPLKMKMSYWFVGLYSDDQLPKFLAEGIWVNGYTDVGVYDDNLLAALLCRHSSVNGKGCLPAAAFLTKKCEGFHGRFIS